MPSAETMIVDTSAFLAKLFDVVLIMLLVAIASFFEIVDSSLWNFEIYNLSRALFFVIKNQIGTEIVSGELPVNLPVTC